MNAFSPERQSCCACGRPINVGRYTNLRGEDFHDLCWQKICNDYYYEQTLDDDQNEAAS